MAPRTAKELICVVVDVSQPMHADLPVVAEAVTELFHRKLFGKATAASIPQVALLLSGSNRTDNELTSEAEAEGNPDQYPHQEMLLPLHALTREEVKNSALLPIYASAVDSNLLDALAVAQDALVKAKNALNGKATARIIFVTDLVSDKSNPADAEGDDAEFMSILAESLPRNEVTLQCHVIPRPGDAHKTAAYAALRELCEKVGGAWHEEPAHEGMLRAPVTRAVAPTTLARVNLDLGPWLSLPVFLFKATDEAKMPSFVMHSTLGNPDDPALTHKVDRETEYQPVDNPGVIHVSSEGRTKAYRYGTDLVPLNPAELIAAKFKPAATAGASGADDPFKGMQLVGFTSREALPQHLSMGNSDYVLPAPPKSHPSKLWASGGSDATTAARAAAGLSALARALAESDSVAVVRVLLRKGGDLRLCALAPVLSDKGDYLIMTTLPFAEDVRVYDFPPLPADEKQAPSAEACAAAEQLVDAMMFPAATDAAGGSSFEATGDSRLVYNPTLRRFSEFIKRRAVDPEAPVPPWSDDLLPRAIATPKAVEAVAAFAAAAPTRAAPPSKRGGRHQEAAAGDAADAAEEPDAKRHREDHLPPFTLAAEAAPRILIGDTDPLTDFSREMAKATDVVAKLTVLHAMPQVMADIIEFQSRMPGGRWPTVIDCHKAMRAACVELGMPTTFQHALQLMFERSRGEANGGIWGALQAAGLKPITTDEVPGPAGALSPDAAQAFMARDPEAEPQEQAHDTEPDEGDEDGAAEHDEFADADG